MTKKQEERPRTFCITEPGSSDGTVVRVWSWSPNALPEALAALARHRPDVKKFDVYECTFSHTVKPEITFTAVRDD